MQLDRTDAEHLLHMLNLFEQDLRSICHCGELEDDAANALKLTKQLITDHLSVLYDLDLSINLEINKITILFPNPHLALLTFACRCETKVNTLNGYSINTTFCREHKDELPGWSS